MSSRGEDGRWPRFRRLSWDELRVRGRQECSKRWDTLRWKFGARFGPPAVANPFGEARFFFSTADVPAILAALKQRLPNQVEDRKSVV